jgi:hypothetical protein
MCGSLFKLVDKSMNHQDILIVLKSPEKPRFLSIRAQVINLRDVGATHIRRLAGELSFDLRFMAFTYSI